MLALILLLSGCKGSNTVSSSDSSVKNGTESSVSSSGESPSGPQVEGANVVLSIPKYSASLDQLGNLDIDYGAAETADIAWYPPDGYKAAEDGQALTPPGIQNPKGTLTLDMLQWIYSETTDLLEYQNALPSHMDLFHQTAQSQRYTYFVSAIAGDGSGWNKNQQDSKNFGYLLDVYIRLDSQNFLRFHYYFHEDQKVESYEELPGEVKDELTVLIDSFESLL